MNRFASIFLCWVIIPVVTTITLLVIHDNNPSPWPFFGTCCVTFLIVLLVTSCIKKGMTGKAFSSGKRAALMIVLIPIRALIYAFMMVSTRITTDGSFVGTMIAFSIYLVIFYTVIYALSWILTIALVKNKKK